MRRWRGWLVVAALLLVATACGTAEEVVTESGGDPTATFMAAKASLLLDRSVQATQTAELRPTSTPVPPTATPTLTPTPRPTRTPTPSPTPQTEPVVVASEDFADTIEMPIWTGVDGLYTADVADGVFAVTIEGEQSRHIDLDGLEELGDAIIQVDLRFEGEGSAGIYARLAGDADTPYDRGYRCALRDTGTLWCLNGVAGEWACLCSLDTYSLAFEGVNTLQVTMVGDTIQIALNGAVLNTETDPSSAFGEWGLYAANRSDRPFRAWFDNLVITRLPPGYQLDAAPGV